MSVRKVQMKRTSRAITFTVIVAFGLSLFAASPASAEKKAKNSKKASQVAKVQTLCKPTKAVGHKPMKLPVPEIKKPFVNRTFILTTNCGEIQIEADGINAPLTVISMSYLANKGFFNNSLCHRVTNQGIFVLQCGDPSGTGSGGPAYTAPDENLPKGTGNIYPAGSVAMANSGPNTNGSQFFIIYEDNSRLAPNYTLWGKVVKGLDIVKAVAAFGSDNSHPAGGGVPNQPIAIEKAIAR
jgi:peptidyl-prolyl cis-trans isomerase B (cyclophilin B)